ncbi:penicillin acylase family protein [Salinactinospora qingdaonensis]|uniref:Penicillin acylase family protein n=1 Tax=Salinactinospora qingdaonensis TaxID=702744 RepID=A0ABP7FK00_9ACTN
MIAVVTVVVMVTTGALVWTVQRSFPEFDGQLNVPVLDSDVTVYRDALGVPQIYAETTQDLFRAQGYVHAQDRFWEMDFRRHLTAGRLAELFGPDQLETDIYLRTMGWRRVAEQEYELLGADTRRYLDAYAEGVNAYLAEHDGAEVSLEYAVLGVIGGGGAIEEWTPVDSLAWLKAMAWNLRGNMVQEIDRATMLANGLTRAQVEELYPAYPQQQHTPIVTSGRLNGGAFEPDAGQRSGSAGQPPQEGAAEGDGSPADESRPPQSGEMSATQVERAQEEAASLVRAVGTDLSTLSGMVGRDSTGLGSNSWVVSGEHTASGMPLLANDPHLGASMPSVWHQSGLHCVEVGPECPFDVVGFGFAGLPGIVIGHNRQIAWGLTNLGPDVTDLYLEKIEGDTYLVDGEKRALRTRTETITVAGADDVEITVRSTEHGPLLSDAAAGAKLREIGATPPVTAEGEPAEQAQPGGDYGVALRWTALEPGTTADAIFQLNQAGDFAEFREAARLFEVPAQNLVYADVEGNIGYQAPGTIPIRGRGQGRWPAPGWNSAYDWTGVIPFDQLPWAFNPERGYIVTANQAVIDTDYTNLLTTDWAYGYRSQRINTMLATATDDGGGLTVADMSQMQYDSLNAGARAIVPHLLQAQVEGVAAQAQRLLGEWDFQQDVDSAAAAFYNATWRHLLALTFDELDEEMAMSGGSRGFLVVSRLLDDPGSPWWDSPGGGASGRDAVVAAALERAAVELSERLGDDPSQWRWGELHMLTVRNESLGTSGVAPVEWLFNRGPVEAPGGTSIVNATGWDTSTPGYEIYRGPSMRMVLDLSDLDASRWSNLTGTSGHAFHPNYADQLPMWAQGESAPMPFTRSAVEEAAEHELVLAP